MFFFSLHPNQTQIGSHSKYSSGWNVKFCNSLAELAPRCTQYLNSPIVWSYGVRKQLNFIYSDFAVIDVDDDSKLNLRAAVEYFKPYVHIIGTTKSHQQLKGNKVSDRYRVFVLMERRITHLNDYKAICMNQAMLCGGDLQAGGGAMHFMPLKEIINVVDEGRKLPNEVFIRKPSAERKFHSDATGGVTHVIPSYIQRWLDGDVHEGQRNLCVFKAACGLRKRGFSHDEILNVVLNSRLPIDRSERVEKEIHAAVASAMRR